MKLLLESAIRSQTGNLMKNLAEELLLELEMPMKFGSVNWNVVKAYITPSWIGSLVQFLSTQALDVLVTSQKYHY